MMDGNFVWDVYQQHALNKLKQTFTAAKQAIAQDQAGQAVTLERLEDKLNCLALICRAMAELLAERTGVTEQDLVRKITEVDLRDGKADGKMTAAAKPCPSCGSMMSPRFNRCLFCGHKDVDGDAFNAVK